MSQNYRQTLKNPPIIEAVVGFDCMMPLGFELSSMEEAAKEKLSDRYPEFRKQYVHESEIIQAAENPPELKNKTKLNSLQFVAGDKLQLLQFRESGYSFNRLKSYSSFDDYIEDIKEGWLLFVALANPERIKKLSMRNINRLELPIEGNSLELSDYFTTAPKIPVESGLSFQGFIHKYNTVENSTGNQASIVLASENQKKDYLPVILDVTVSREVVIDPQDTDQIESIIDSLRDLKDRVFHNSITETCRQTYQ